MGGAFEREVIAWLSANISPTIIAVIFITFLSAWITYKVNKLVNAALMEVTELKSRVAILEKQQSKNIQLVSNCPCVSKINGLWLSDVKRNGGQPPEAIECIYLSAKRRVE